MEEIYNHAIDLYEGKTLSPNQKEAIKLLKHCISVCEKDNQNLYSSVYAEALYFLAMHYYDNAYSSGNNENTGYYIVELLTKATQSGHIKSMNQLASIYYNGFSWRVYEFFGDYTTKSIARDVNKVVKFLTTAAEEGSVAAMFLLSNHYLREGTQNELMKAVTWYKLLLQSPDKLVYISDNPKDYDNFLISKKIKECYEKIIRLDDQEKRTQKALNEEKESIQKSLSELEAKVFQIVGTQDKDLTTNSTVEGSDTQQTTFSPSTIAK